MTRICQTQKIKAKCTFRSSLVWVQQSNTDWVSQEIFPSLSWKYEPWHHPASELSSAAPRRVGSGVQAPVDCVEQQVGQREGQAWVRVDHVAVADQQVHVFTQRSLPPQPSALCGTDIRVLARRGQGVRGQRGCQPRECGQFNVVIMETTIKGHRLAGIKGGGDLKIKTWKGNFQLTFK